ncbi:hypothetical protein [Arthrobacter methylotrophus]|uniref:hypothetical protein n=1 Tax=Arthrobacter methylotrophus TaxID=121291 RepID=UPI0036733EE2
MASRAEEEHARIVLEGELGVEFQHHDDGSKPSMPDLLSLDGNHVAEVITTTPPAVREAQQRLDSMPDAALPHCVLVMVPYTIVGGATKAVRHKIKADVLWWTAKPGCKCHWSSPDERQLRPGVDPDPILGLRAYDDGVNVLCVQRCQHSDIESHQIEWSIVHEPSPDDPWELIRQSLHIVDKEQHGGVQALAKKLNGYSSKHLVMYPFGPPGNQTAEFSRYVPPSNSRELMVPQLNPPLADIHVWLLYRYGNRDAVEGLHVCGGHWAKFGTTFPKADDPSSPLRRLHYRDAEARIIPRDCPLAGRPSCTNRER